MEAQRFPDDYNGIVAGAPAANWTRFQTGGHLWVALAMNNGSRELRAREQAADPGRRGQRRVRHALTASATACLDDPRQCKFDPEVLMCRDGKDAPSCLTPKQVRAVKTIWSGSRNRIGVVYPGYMPGRKPPGGWALYMTGTGPLTGNHWGAGR